MSLFAVLLSSSESFLFTTIRDSPGRLSLHKELAMIIRISKGDLEDFRSPQRPSRPPDKMNSNGLSDDQGRNEEANPIIHVHIKWNMVFTWQAPMMLMAYSAFSFIAGLAIYILTPLYDGREFDGSSKVCLDDLQSFQQPLTIGFLLRPVAKSLLVGCDIFYSIQYNRGLHFYMVLILGI